MRSVRCAGDTGGRSRTRIPSSSRAVRVVLQLPPWTIEGRLKFELNHDCLHGVGGSDRPYSPVGSQCTAHTKSRLGWPRAGRRSAQQPERLASGQVISEAACTWSASRRAAGEEEGFGVGLGCAIDSADLALTEPL